MTKAVAALIALSALVASGCGYALEGRAISIDPSIKRIGVPLFKDETGRPDLDGRITEWIINELLKRGRFTVVKEDTNVDAIVDGTITSFEAEPINFTASGQVTEATRYMITMRASVVFRQVGQKEPIWENRAITIRDEYDLDDSQTNFFDREEQSEERVAEAFARQVVSSMLVAF